MTTELETINDMQFNELKELLEEDFVELVTNFLVDSKDKLLALKKAYQAEDNLTAYDTVHSLKGACANLGATALADVCLQMQMACRERRLNTAQELITSIETELEKVTQEVNTRLA